MAAPKIQFTIEPFVNGTFRFLRFAPSTLAEGERFQLSFQTAFTNNEPQTVHISKLRISFSNASQLGQHDIAIKTLQADLSSINGLDVPSSMTVAPMDFKQTDNIILTQTPLSPIQFDVFVDGFSQPASVTTLMGHPEIPVVYRWMTESSRPSQPPCHGATTASMCSPAERTTPSIMPIGSQVRITVQNERMSMSSS